MTSQEESEEVTELVFRNAISDWDHVPSDLVAEGADTRHPRVTIAITTFKRVDFLLQSIESALGQDWGQPYEIVVVDNDPSSGSAEALLTRFPMLRERSFRYFVNRENIGLFGNHNRCIQLARGEWMTILNDDDLLDPDFLRTMFALLDKRSDVDGLICCKRVMDERPAVGEGALRSSAAWKLVRASLNEWSFLGRRTRRIKISKFFWGAMVGNCAGWIFRREQVAEIGGFYPEEFPSADMCLFARFAKVRHFRQHRATKATFRVAQNESANATTIKSSFHRAYILQGAMVGRDVPRWWNGLRPMLISRWLAALNDGWRLNIPLSEVEDLIGIKLPPDRPILVRALQVIFRGY